MGNPVLLESGGKRMCGTPGYMAPEVLRYEGADTRSDVYSFGLVLWQMASGSRVPPFMVRWPGNMKVLLQEIYKRQRAEKVPRVNGYLDPVIHRCLKPRPDHRYASFHALRGALEVIWTQRTGRTFAVPVVGEKTSAFWTARGASLHALGHYQEAIACYDKALALKPQYIAVYAAGWSNKGSAFGELRLHRDAVACYDKALAVFSGSADIWSNKGHQLSKLGHHDEAIVCYEKALALDATDANAWSNKADALQSLTRREEAIACYDRALAIDARLAVAWNNKGIALAALGKPAAAIECYERALAVNPLDANTWCNKGCDLQTLGDHSQAIKCFDEGLKADPRNARIWENKASSLRAAGNREEAIACLDKALEIQPQSPLWLLKGCLLAGLGRNAEAVECFDKMIQIDAGHAKAWYNKALAEEALKHFSAAGKCYRNFIDAASPRDANEIAHAKQRLDSRTPPVA
jgi:tetratricopeptide (TPR) repeat protein